MEERSGAVTVKGNPLTLMGPALKVGDKAPEFVVLNNDLDPVSLSEFSGKIRIISSVASLDTSVCDMETRRFNQEAANLGNDVVILTVSMDLPLHSTGQGTEPGAGLRGGPESSQKVFIVGKRILFGPNLS